MDLPTEQDSAIQRSIGTGIKIVAEKIPKYYSFSLGLFINCGSRDETKRLSGITHFMEHMLFKGTARKSSLEIVKLIESLGGAFDAFTTKENLVIVTRFLSEHINRVFELILEILYESKIASNDLKKERSVILEEIKTDNEDPDDHVFDMVFETVFGEHPMAMPIAGTVKSVQGITLKMAKKYYQGLLKKQMVIAISGNFDYDSLLRIAGKRFAGHVPKMDARVAPGTYSPRNIVQRKKDISQVHIAFGMPGVAYSSPLRFPLLLLNTIFGGGMSSRLFQGLREKEGLVYDVHSFIDLYTDCGIAGLYLACDKKNLKRAARTLKAIFKTLQNGGFSDEEINIAKTYVTGNLLLSLENSTNRMLRMGREVSYLDRILSIDETVQMVNQVTVAEVNGLINDYLDPRKYSVAAIGPVNEKEINQFYNSVIP